MKNMRKIVVLAFLVFASEMLFAAWTPTSDFTDNGDGTVTHKLTGLTWMRCAMGQTWTDSTCSGDGSFYTWEKAAALTSNFADKTDWRLPTPWELASIVDFSASNPAANATIFPNMAIAHYAIYSACGISSSCGLIPVAYYWTGLPSKNIGSGYYWYVDFVNGAINDAYHDITLANRYNYYFVRMVRNGNSPGAATTPGADFTDNADGTVTHNKTNLTWLRCAVGQTWTGSGCSGSADVYGWSQATALSTSFAGYSDWRLPNIEELVSIVEYGANGPAINAAIFPATPSTNFWSSSFAAGSPDYIYGVNFNSGATSKGSNSSSFAVRLVRGSQAPGVTATLPATVSDCIFNWAENTFPQHFSPPGGTSANLASYYYRYYSTTGNFLATSSADNHVWALGPTTGNALLDVGPAASFLSVAGCQTQ